jgi:hypothetical protein
VWGLSRGFFNFFYFLFEKSTRQQKANKSRSSRFHSLSTPIFYHTLSQNASGNVAQVSGKNSRHFCAKFLLTKMPGYGIMVNSARVGRARAVKF